MKITFSSYEAKLANVDCDSQPPPQPIDEASKKRVADALNLIPTNQRKLTTFNRTRISPQDVTYLLPRLEPAGKLLSHFAMRSCQIRSR